MKIPSPEEFRQGYQEFQRREKRDAMYKIARAYGCHYSYNPSEKYLSFIKLCKLIAVTLQPAINGQEMGKTLLKLIDEYNYAKYTKGWV